MRKQIRKILILIASLLLFCTLTGCGSETIVVNVEDQKNISGSNFGIDALIDIGDGLYYDSTTRIVYLWNGCLNLSYYSTTPTPYYAPNGLPYKYNPETNTFEEIEVNVNE